MPVMFHLEHSATPFILLVGSNSKSSPPSRRCLSRSWSPQSGKTKSRLASALSMGFWGAMCIVGGASQSTSPLGWSDTTAQSPTLRCPMGGRLVACATLEAKSVLRVLLLDHAVVWELVHGIVSSRVACKETSRVVLCLCRCNLMCVLWAISSFFCET
jgi:hypothetical protein